MKKYIPDCYWPSSSNGEYASHEAVCVLNAWKSPVTVEITLFFEDRDPETGFSFEIEAERTKHIRMDRITGKNGEKVPKDTPYAVLVECEKDIFVQYTRVDTTQAELALMTAVI